jgi:cobalt/nickel transport system permease protein
MHIPDGFLNAKTAAVCGILATTGLGLALRHARRHLPARRVPLLGLAAAFVFAAQMLNFPVAGGTSGHLVGGVMAAALLGPAAAVIVLSAVLIVQCFLFADGGVSALGANIFNMGILGGVGGWGIYRLVSRLFPGLFGRILAASFAAWCSTLIAAIACAGELSTSHTVQWSVAWPAMTGIHLFIGIGEGLITALVLVAIARVRPDLLEDDAFAPPARPYGMVLAFGGLIALGLALFVSPFASHWPDGLDKTAEVLGFKHRASGPIIAAPIADYEMPGIPGGSLSVSIAGVAGTIVVFALAWILARVLVPRTAASGSPLADLPDNRSRVQQTP